MAQAQSARSCFKRLAKASGDGCSASCKWDAATIASGGTETCSIGGNGVLKCWGANWLGAAGLGDSRAHGDAANEMGAALLAVDLGNGRVARQVSTNGLSCALLDDASVKCWGGSHLGQLGQGNALNHGSTPGTMGDALPKLALGTGRTAKGVGAGADFACALLDNGGVKCWGNNQFGQLGQGDTSMRGVAAGEMGDALLPIDFGGSQKAKALAVGGYRACAILESGLVKCWGYNDFLRAQPDGRKATERGRQVLITGPLPRSSES